jgi:L-fuconolactonase
MQRIQRDFMPYELSFALKESGIDGCVAVQADQSETETAFLVRLGEQHDFIKGIVGWIDLRSEYLPERLAFYHQYCSKVKGFRHIVQAEPDDEFLLQPDFCSGIAQLKQYNFTYDILIYPKQLSAAIRFVEKFPDQPFVIDHLAKPFIKDRQLEPWATQMKEIAMFPNVCCKVSGMVTEADWGNWKKEDLIPYIDVVTQAFGPERLMFGSDWPVCLVAAEYDKVVSIIRDFYHSYPQAQQEAIMGGNAIRFYNL